MDFYTTGKIVSYNAVFNFVVTERNVGKTTAFKIRSLKKFIARGKKTVWVRRYGKEKKNTAQKFYTAKILKLAGVPAARVKTEGNKCFFKNDKGKWVDFLEFCTVSEASNNRSADDPATSDIIFDEFAVTRARGKHYHGNEVEDFIDLFISKKRVNRVSVFFLGNRESYYNQYFEYFKIPKFEPNFEGVRTFRGGSIAVQIMNGVPDPVKDVYDAKIQALFKDTPYGEYLLNSAVKGASAVKIEQCPKGAEKLFQLDIDFPLSVYQYGGKIYVKKGIDASRRVFVTTPKNYRNLYVIRQNDKPLFLPVIEKYKNGRVFYDAPEMAEYFKSFLSVFGL